MAEIVVEFLLKELFQVLKDEFNLQRGVKEDMESVKDELESITAFLKYLDANKLEYDDPRLGSWVKQVRDVAFDIQDVVDEFLLRFVDPPSNKIITCVCSICSFIKNRKFNHRIGSELRSIKAKVVEIAERPKRYGYSPLPSNQGSSVAMASTDKINQFRRNAMLVDESQLVGTEESKQRLMKWLSEGDSNLKVCAIVGMGGLGKTTLANQVYRDYSIKVHFTNRAFVTVSQSLKEEELLKDMIQQLFTDEKHVVLEGIHKMSSLQLKEKMKDLLQQRRYLIVLDDVWETDHWDCIKLAMPRNDRFSRVIITTRKDEVAKYSATEFQGMVHNLPPLSDSDSWTLFCKKAFSSQTCPSYLEPICKSMLRRCGGLPLAILTLSGLLATKDEHKVEEWEMVQRILNVELGENPRFHMMNQVLSLSFEDLPYHLKPCFLLLSVFPEDYLMEPMLLVRLWISEGFVREKDESMTLEEVGERYLHELLNRSLIQIKSIREDGRIEYCCIHDFLREIILHKSREQSFLEVISWELNTRKWPERARRLSIHHVDDDQGNVYQNFRSSLLSRLRSLFLFQTSGNLVMPKLLGSFKLLSVLDLRGAPLETFPETISKLFLLKYLSLRQTKISRLPASIGNLQSLETLDLKQTYITWLPSEISNLHKLRHLLIYHYEEMDEGVIDGVIPGDYGMIKIDSGLELHGFNATPAIAGLLSLQKLCILDVSDHEDDAFINGLGRLTQLRRLCLANLKEQHWNALCSSISKMRNLRSLALHTKGTFDLQNISSPPPLLQRLYLTGKLDKLPSWLCPLQNLRILQLVGTQLKEDPMPCLGNLSSSVRLTVCHVFDDDLNCSFTPGAFERTGWSARGRDALNLEGMCRQYSMMYGFG